MSRNIEPTREDYQIVVVGGGLAGVCAAVAAARQGLRTVLVQNRPVLGGNSSAEIGVPPHGADQAGDYRHVRETGIIDEIATANANFPNYLDSPSIWSVVLWAFCREEENLTVYLNAQASDVATQGNRIVSVRVDQQTTEKSLIISGRVFIDCSGDGGLAYRAGAEVMTGREGRDRFGESMAPETADQLGMGHSVYIRARGVDQAVPFPTPPWAHVIPGDESLPDKALTCPHRIEQLTKPRGGWWWIEHGGTRDRIADAEIIRDELYRYAIGVWDHLKNRGEHGAGNYVLESIITTPGKRDSRRFVGDYVMVQSDVMSGRVFEDAVAYGGWHVDIHNPKGIAGDTYWYGKLLNGIYTIPYRSLYSKNIGNLLFAGRNISASHVAFATTRVMLTCSLMGQAVGNAAALCIRHGCDPRDVHARHLGELRQELLKQDCYIPGVRDEDRENLARQATVTASSARVLHAPQAEEFQPLDVARGQMFVLSEKFLKRVGVMLQNTTDAFILATGHLRAAKRIDDFTSREDLASVQAQVSPGCSWVDFVFDVELPEANAPYWMEIEAAPGVAWGYARAEEPASQAAALKEQYFTEPGTEWFMHRIRGTHSFRVEPSSKCYGPAQVVSGVARPDKASNIWISDDGFPHHLELFWKESVFVGELHLTFDHRIDRTIAKWAREGPAGELVKDYSVSLFEGDRQVETIDVTENTLRKRIHRFSPRNVSRVRIDFKNAWGGQAARVFEVRVY